MSRTSTTLRTALLSLLTALTLGLGLLAAPAVAADSPESSAAAQKQAQDKTQKKKTSGYRIATLNLENGMSARSMRHDVLKVIGTRHPTVIGFQERRDSRPALRAALPKGWALRMPVTAPGTDDNPIAFDKRVWKVKYSWPRLLAKHTWHRNSGQEAIDQYGVVVVLQHRRSGHTIRAISFHMPNLIHNRSTGGPNWAERERLGAFWRMAANVREVARSTPKGQQFVALCDCNVTESRDRSGALVKGQLTRPLGLENNYSAAGYHFGWRIDYVMAERRSKYRIASWRVLHELRTDHPAVVTRFKKKR
jgi:hypothetical protein